MYFPWNLLYNRRNLSFNIWNNINPVYHYRNMDTEEKDKSSDITSGEINIKKEADLISRFPHGLLCIGCNKTKPILEFKIIHHPNKRWYPFRRCIPCHKLWYQRKNYEGKRKAALIELRKVNSPKKKLIKLITSNRMPLDVILSNAIEQTVNLRMIIRNGLRLHKGHFYLDPLFRTLKDEIKHILPFLKDLGRI